MHRALLELTIDGVETSRDFHLRVMEDEEFRRGDIEIQWLERRLPSLVGRRRRPTSGVRAAAIAAALLARARPRRAADAAHAARGDGAPAPARRATLDATGCAPRGARRCGDATR